MVQLGCHLVVEMELINILKKSGIFCSCTWTILVQYIQESTKSRNTAYFSKNVHRIGDANQKSVTKSKGFFTQTSHRRFPSYTPFSNVLLLWNGLHSGTIQYNTMDWYEQHSGIPLLQYAMFYYTVIWNYEITSIYGKYTVLPVLHYKYIILLILMYTLLLVYHTFNKLFQCTVLPVPCTM